MLGFVAQLILQNKLSAEDNVLLYNVIQIPFYNVHRAHLRLHESESISLSHRSRITFQNRSTVLTFQSLSLSPSLSLHISYHFVWRGVAIRPVLVNSALLLH